MVLHLSQTMIHAEFNPLAELLQGTKNVIRSATSKRKTPKMWCYAIYTCRPVCVWIEIIHLSKVLFFLKVHNNKSPIISCITWMFMHVLWLTHIYLYYNFFLSAACADLTSSSVCTSCSFSATATPLKPGRFYTSSNSSCGCKSITVLGAIHHFHCLPYDNFYHKRGEGLEK